MRKIKLTSISKNPKNRLTKMSMRPNLLDFTASGQAVIDMPNYGEISFLENFGFSPIESVEQEIQQADTPERAVFLQHYVDTYKRTFTEPPKNYQKDPEDLEEGLSEFEALNNNSIHLRNVRLLHTTAWYMMGHVDAEIRAIKRYLKKRITNNVWLLLVAYNPPTWLLLCILIRKVSRINLKTTII